VVSVANKAGVNHPGSLFMNEAGERISLTCRSSSDWMTKSAIRYDCRLRIRRQRLRCLRSYRSVSFPIIIRRKQ